MKRWDRMMSATLALFVTAAPGTLAAQDHPDLLRIRPRTLAELREWDGRIDAMLRDGTLRTRTLVGDPLVAGREHQRADQYYRGVRIFGGDVVRQIAGGQTISVFGTIYTGIDLDPHPTLSADDVVQALERLTGARPTGAREPELVVLPRPSGGYALTYRARVMSRRGPTVYFIDALSGNVVLEYSDLKTQSAAVGRGRGVLGDDKKVSVSSWLGTYVASDELRPPAISTFDMKGDVQRTLDFLEGTLALAASDLAAKSDNTWDDGATVDAHAYAGWTYDYYFKRFERRGLDNGDMRIVSVVHPVRRQDLLSSSDEIIGLFFLNAFYAGEGVMVYGEGLPPGYVLAGSRQTVDFLAGALDIVAHELTHGVTDFTSQLIYMNEPGALNEAFSDIMGTSVEFFYEPPGTGLRRADYLLGEDVFRPGGIRSMDNPRAFGDPDHYRERFTGTEDNGGVHINSAIPNQAFYLAIEGGSNRTSGMGVQGVGGGNREQIERIFYRAFTLMLPANASFSVARATCEQAARDLYGTESAAFQAVSQAWAAVGVN